MLFRFLTIILPLTLIFSSLSLHAQSVPGGGDNGGGSNTGTGGGGNVNPGQEGSDKPTPEGAAVDLLNASFETGTDAPENWTPLAPDVGHHYNWDSEVALLGERSISVGFTRYFYGRWSSDALAIEGAGFQWYTLTGKVATVANNGEVYLAIAWLNQDGDVLTSSDSPMLPVGDNDWSTVTVSALPPADAAQLRVWCVCNHNDGEAWFDALELTRTAFTAANAVSYAQFLLDYPTHPLAIEANVMQVQELMTEAKWIKEDGFYVPAAQLRASELYAQAAGVVREDTVFSGVFAALHPNDEGQRAEALTAAQTRFDGLIDLALWNAVQTSESGGDTEQADALLLILEDRGSDLIEPVGTTNGGNGENGGGSPPIPE